MERLTPMCACTTTSTGRSRRPTRAVWSTVRARRTSAHTATPHGGTTQASSSWWRKAAGWMTSIATTGKLVLDPSWYLLFNVFFYRNRVVLFQKKKKKSTNDIGLYCHNTQSLFISNTNCFYTNDSSSLVKKNTNWKATMGQLLSIMIQSEFFGWKNLLKHKKHFTNRVVIAL